MAWHKESKRHSEVQRKPSRFSKAQIEADYNSVSKPEFQTHKYTPDFQKAGVDLKKALDAGKFSMFGQQKVEEPEIEFPLPDLKNNEKKEAYEEFLVYMDDGGEPTAFRYNDDGDLETAVGSDWYLQKEVSKGIFNSLGKYVPKWIRDMDA